MTALIVRQRQHYHDGKDKGRQESRCEEKVGKERAKTRAEVRSTLPWNQNYLENSPLVAIKQDFACKTVFERFVRDVLIKIAGTKEPMSLSKKALDALRWAAEDYLSHIFKDADASALHAGRKTTMLKDMHFAID